MLAVGPNGAGKTNLLESLHVATQGFSPRTRSDAQLIRFGAEGARVEVAGEHGGTDVEIEVTLKTGEAKRALVNGSQLRAAEELRSRLPTLVFTPDRLAIVKGGPAVRRAYFDRTLGRLFPSRAPTATDYASALAQRNGALRRVAAGYSSRDALEPWTRQVAELGRLLVAARGQLVELLSPAFAECAAEFGLEEAALEYEGQSLSAQDLEARLEQDSPAALPGRGPTSTTWLSSPAPATSATSARKGSSGWPSFPCSSRKQTCSPSAAHLRHFCSWTTFSPSSIPTAESLLPPVCDAPAARPS